MFKRNAAIVGFGIGHFINATTGAAVTTGTPTCKRTLDGTGGACANAASYNTDGAVWEIDLAAADMNGDVVVLSFTLADCLPIAYTIRTSTKLVSDLNDYAGGDTSGTTTLLTRLSEARAGALTDWIDGGRLDLLIDAIKAKTDLGLLNTTWTDAKAGCLDEAISAAKTLTAAYDAAKTAAAAGAAMALTSGERTTLAAAIEAAIINELDGTAVMQAIADLIASDMTTGDLSVVAIATATRDAILNRVLAGNHDTASTAGLLLQYLDATISSRHASGAAVAKSPATLDWSADVSNKPTIGTSTFDPATDTVANVTTVATCTTNTDMRGTDGAYTGTPPTAEAIADQVWDEATAGHTGAGSYGKAVGDGVTTWVTATGFSTHSAADVVTALGTGSTLTACLTATGFSTHSAADVVTAFGTGSTLTDCATATGFSTHSAADVVTALGTGSTLTACVTATGFSTHSAADVVTALGTGSTLTDCATATGFAVPGSAMALTSGERTTLAAAIEAAIINELDGTAVMQAIADLIASDMTTGDLSVVAIATATRDAILNRVLAGNHDTASTAGLLLQYLDATISSRHASGAAVAKSPATLDWSADVSNKPTIGTSTFDPATDTVANVTTVATCTTNTDMRGTDSAALAATALSTAVWTNTKAGYIDAAVSGIPTNPMLDTEDGSSFSAIPDMATATNQSTIAGYIDTEVGTIIEHLTDIKGTGFAKDTHSLPQCLTAAGFSTFNAASDKVYLANGAHGGAAATLVLSDYSDFQGAAGGGDASAENQTAILAVLNKFGFTASGEDWLVNAQTQGLDSNVITSDAFATDAINSGAIATTAAQEIAGWVFRLPESNAGYAYMQSVIDDCEAAASVVGTGGASTPIDFTVGGNPVEGVEIYITDDLAGAHKILGPQYTNSSGQVTYLLDAASGPFYAWARKNGVTGITNPTTLTWNSVTEIYEAS